MGAETRPLSRIDEERQLLTSACERMDEAHAAIAAAPDSVDEEQLDALQGAFDGAEADVRKYRSNIDRLERIAQARAEILKSDEETEERHTERAATATGQKPPERVARPARSVVIGKEPLTYERGNGNSFFADLYRSTKGTDFHAQERLRRHAFEAAVERRDINGVDNTGGDFVFPTYMAAEWINLARAGRPLANAVRHLPLPPNTDSINMPRLSTGTATAVQASENASIQETDATTGTLSVPVATVAGQQDVSRQAVERSTPGLDEIVLADLAADYATKLDVQVISGSGSAGQAKGILTATGTIAVTYTDSTPTVPELYSKLADSVQQIHSNRYQSPTAIVMHPRRWGWFLASLDGNSRPLVLPASQSPFNPIGLVERVGAENVVGQIMGLPVIVDASLTTNNGTNTNEDVIIVTRLEDLYLFEDAAPRTRVFEEIGSQTLTIRFQVFGYFAFTAERFAKSTAKINGTGLVPPVF